MKARDWSAVIAMCLLGLVCLYFAIEAVIADEVICLSRGCTQPISLSREPTTFYFNAGGLLLLAAILMGWSIQIVFSKKNRG